MSLRRFFQVGVLFTLSPLAIGFEGDEHREMSDLALSIALEYHCPRTDTPRTAKCEKIRKAVEALNADNEALMSYGMINQVVDYMHYPEMVFDATSYPVSKESLNQHVPKLLEKRSKYLVLFDYLSASSHNERHFQADMLKSLNILHLAAINQARDGQIFHALVYNALSDHYLNDFFAPGHVTTPRENSHDTVAMAMHDWANRAGTCFRIDSTTWTELEDILRFIEDSGIAILDEDIDDHEVAKDNLAECDNTDVFDLINLEPAKLQQKTIASLTNSHDKIFLEGDGYLIRNPRQKLFMLLVQVQSISEVIGSYIDCAATPACVDHTKSATKYEWSGSYAKGKIVPPRAKIRYGEYEIKADYETEKVYFFLKRPKYAYPAVADNAFLMSIGGQTLPHEPARFEAQLELFPMKIGTTFEKWRDRMIQRPSSDCKLQRRRLCNIGIAYGITHFRGDDFRSTGGQIRFIKAYPKISGQMSLYLRRGNYDGRNEDSWRNAYGIRYDHGFSLHSFYVGYQRDYGFDSTGQFGRENIASFGWTLTFPSSRFLGFFGGYK